jgi:membrane associated rhomboid family serine protease
MAANDYYNAFHPPQQQDTSYHGAGAIGESDFGRTNAPLPPVPATSSPKPYKPSVDTHGIPPVSSPFDDNQYPAYPRPSQQEGGSGRQSPLYYGKPGEPGPRYSYNDPFGDSNAIPLQNQGKDNKLGGVGVMASPTSAMGEAEHGPIRRQDDRRRRRKKDGWFTGKITWACYILFLIQFGVFIAEIVRNATLTGSPIEIHPSFNPMIGPSPYVLINMGARYVPCMRSVNATVKDTKGKIISEIPVEDPTVNMQCPNTTTNDAKCHLADLCGFSMNLNAKSDGTIPQPNQWWRFITPIFLHGGIIHIGFNMLLQLTLGRDIERQIGTLRFLLIYFSAGIFGFVFGGNFAPNGVPSTGCSGSLFGIIALTLLDLLYTWKNRKSPGKELLFIGLDVVISFVLGLLPGLDNFSHIGGFLVGLLLGISLMHSPDALRERIGLDDAKYATVPHISRDGEEVLDQKNSEGLKSFAKQPVGFFKGRKPLWWGWWLLRAGALVLVVVVFAVLINNFYKYHSKCAWCKYLSCLVSPSLS